MWTPEHYIHMWLWSIWKIYGVSPPFAAITASTLLGRLYTWCCNMAAGICSIQTYEVRQSAFQFIPKVVQVWALCRAVKFFHTRLSKSFIYAPRETVKLKQKRYDQCLIMRCAWFFFAIAKPFIYNRMSKNLWPWMHMYSPQNHTPHKTSDTVMLIKNK